MTLIRYPQTWPAQARLHDDLKQMFDRLLQSGADAVVVALKSRTIPAAEAQEFKRKARLVEVEWVQDMDKRGYNGRQLLDTARALIAKHGRKA